MADNDLERDAGWRDGASELDRELDAALAKYAAVEPRTGLEERVLANLRAERARVPDRAWWHWGLAGAVAAVVVVALALAWRSGRPSAPVIAHHPPPSPSGATQGPQQPGTRDVANGDGNRVRPREHSSIRTASAHRSHAELVAANPKLEQFPSPEPLSEQEKILQNYVAKYPEQAVLIARAAREAQHRDELEKMQAFASGEPPTDSEEPNDGTTER